MFHTFQMLQHPIIQFQCIGDDVLKVLLVLQSYCALQPTLLHWVVCYNCLSNCEDKGRVLVLIDAGDTKLL